MSSHSFCWDWCWCSRNWTHTHTHTHTVTHSHYIIFAVFSVLLACSLQILEHNMPTTFCHEKSHMCCFFLFLKNMLTPVSTKLNCLSLCQDGGDCGGLHRSSAHPGPRPDQSRQHRIHGDHSSVCAGKGTRNLWARRSGARKRSEQDEERSEGVWHCIDGAVCLCQWIIVWVNMCWRKLVSGFP